MAVTYTITMRVDCEQCHGTGAGNFGPEQNECPACGGDGALDKTTTLTAALADLGILDRLAAVESAARHLEKSAK